MSKISGETLKNAITLPLVVVAVFVSVYLVGEALGLPSQERLIELARMYFDKYGLITVFASAIIEGLLLLGWYYPGSLAIFLGVIFAGKDVSEATMTVLVVALGLFTAYVINFFLGKYGWYRLLLAFGLKQSLANAQQRLGNHGLSGFLLTYWQPNLAALTSTAAGILGIPLRRFLLSSILAVTVWSSFWGVLTYFIGESALSLIGVTFVLVAMGLWIAYRLLRDKLKSEPNDAITKVK